MINGKRSGSRWDTFADIAGTLAHYMGMAAATAGAAIIIHTLATLAGLI